MKVRKLVSNPRVTRFNFAVGNEPILGDKELFFKQMKAQASYLREEAQEIMDACDERNIVGVLDGAVDCWFVREYMDDLCHEQSLRVGLARNLVCENNDTKFSTRYSDAATSQAVHEKAGTPCYIAAVEYEGKEYFTVRRISDDKVLKPHNFEAVDLSGCIPKEWQDV
jgi:hypothetical protein